ncbi:MAG: hypothetical protein LV473_12930 [Nitrospira sp.]|nr:hypothetical protein [Nitrospira sp.]
MSAKKYMSITGASKSTATRDLQDLADKGVLVPTGGGRAHITRSSYSKAWGTSQKGDA